MPSLTWILILLGLGYIGGRFGEAIVRWAWPKIMARLK